MNIHELGDNLADLVYARSEDLTEIIMSELKRQDIVRCLEIDKFRLEDAIKRMQSDPEFMANGHRFLAEILTDLGDVV